MRSQIRKERGFTLIELLVVIAIIALLAAILFPVFAKAQNKAKQTQCLSNVRNLTTAMIMFAQDNRNTYPTITNPGFTNPTYTGSWASQISSYAGSQKIFSCPMDTNGAGYVSYGFNGLLLNPDGTGITTANVSNPSETGIFVDSTSYKYPESGVINWAGDLHGTASASAIGTYFVPRHSYNMTFADGHCESVGGNANQNTDSINSPIHDAFFGAAAFGYVINAGAGAYQPVASTVTSRTTYTDGTFSAACDSGSFSIGGSTTCQPLWDCACAAWVAAGGAQPATNYQGSNAFQAYDLGGRSSYNSACPTAIAKDGMAIIISNSSRLNLKSITPQMIGDIFTLSNSDKIAGTNSVNVYCRCSAANLDTETIQTANGPFVDYGSGTESFLCKFVKANGGTSYTSLAYFPDGIGDPTASQAAYGAFGTTCPAGFSLTCVSSSANMLAAVAADPYGIGYCSVGEADPNKVTIVSMNVNGVIQKYDRSAVEGSKPDDTGTYTLAALPSGANQWVLTRHLYGCYNSAPTAVAAGDPDAAQEFFSFVQSAQFRKSVIFSALFFMP